MNSRTIELIHTYSNYGKGTKDSPVRNIHYLHTAEGDLIVAYDGVSQKAYVTGSITTLPTGERPTAEWFRSLDQVEPMSE